MKHPLQAPFTNALPTPLFLRTMLMPDDAIFPGHEHSWGEFVYAFNGVVQVEVGRDKYLAPPQYGVWLPPNMPHVGFNRREVLQASLYVVDELCQGLPPWPQALLVTSFMRALLNQASTDARDFGSEEHQRLLRTLLGELKAAPVTGTFLPASDDPVLGPLLNHLEKNPQDSR